MTGYGLLKPVNCVKRPFREPLEIYRCDVDGMLVTTSQASLSTHAGHEVRCPVSLNIKELIMIWIGFIK